MKTITYLAPDQQRKARDWAKQNGCEYNPNMMNGEVHTLNHQEVNRQVLFGLANRIVGSASTQLMGGKRDALADIERRSNMLQCNANPRKLWRKFVKNYI